ncbi:MAG: PASTA domain-containing protein, partial [Actinobacteria bacterium]|nr:PASTA domain-containing protein [Actinomycetota bacterium]
LSPFNWDVVVASEHSDEVAAGSVIRTEPADGTSLKEGEVLLVVVSKGATLATLARMPDIAGKAVQEALDELTALGLVPTVKETENEDIPAGATISWIIPEQPGLSPGDEVLKGTAIDVLVSVGPALREVPSLLGLTLDQAQAALVDLKLVLTETPPSKSNAAAEGTIGAQAPPPGTKVPRDSGIAYSISLGPDLVALPNIIGNNFSIVEPRLVESGFLVGKVTGRQQNRLKKALVGGQEVSNGDEVARGATVDLVFP